MSRPKGSPRAVRAQQWTGARVTEVFAELMASAPAGSFTAPVRLVLDEATALAGRSEFGRARAAAEVKPNGDGVVYIGYRVLADPPYRQLGVLAHELGHVALLMRGDEDHSERDADAEAERLFGVKISYDSADIQTVGPGTRPRPARLDARSNPGHNHTKGGC